MNDDHEFIQPIPWIRVKLANLLGTDPGENVLATGSKSDIAVRRHRLNRMPRATCEKNHINNEACQIIEH